jgi:hypothetical protein
MGEMSEMDGGPHWGPDDGLLYRYGGAITCRICKTNGLHWVQLDSGKWWLAVEDGRMHKCQNKEEIKE